MATLLSLLGTSLSVSQKFQLERLINALGLWFAYCAAAMVLALNRVLEFSSKRVCEMLFDGKKCYAWILVVIGYACGVQCTVNKPFYYYNPSEGAFNFFTLNPNPTNMNHVCNNLFKFFFVTISYALMWVLLKIKLRSGGQLGGQISTLEAKVSYLTQPQNL
ncbi:hypothetical protein L596_026671 [Steinernema carpocapsae]|uniref:7TM GPCR serpentine receptor class x (Srx) domain-containing protein n=1 Tax=Steinernema carpocapsae TaxID=34508 RepID=A0A4U5M270_STECR|nr:hypothetical protein L596_026671 [Steinernema carpocapsae]